MWVRFLWLSVAGALGALARFGLTEAVNRVAGDRFPWGTFAVNAVGCLGFGIVWGLAESQGKISAEFRMIALTGFMGAFTTFSTFAFDSARMWQGEQWGLFAIHLAAQNGVGVALVLAGLALTKPA